MSDMLDLARSFSGGNRPMIELNRGRNWGAQVTDLTVPLVERVEYASSGWIAEAKRYLNTYALPRAVV